MELPWKDGRFHIGQVGVFFWMFFPWLFLDILINEHIETYRWNSQIGGSTDDDSGCFWCLTYIFVGRSRKVVDTVSLDNWLRGGPWSVFVHNASMDCTLKLRIYIPFAFLPACGCFQKSGTPKSSIWIGFSIITSIFGEPLFLETPMYMYVVCFFFWGGGISQTVNS